MLSLPYMYFGTLAVTLPSVAVMKWGSMDWVDRFGMIFLELIILLWFYLKFKESEVISKI